MKTRPIFDFVIFLPLLPQMKNDTFQKAFDLDTYLPALDAVSFFGFLSKPQSRVSETTFPKLSYVEKKPSDCNLISWVYNFNKHKQS